MNEFDQFVKHVLHCKHYGRYVDDAFFVDTTKEMLYGYLPQIETFLSQKLHLRLNPSKMRIYSANRGVEFLGAYILPYRRYIANGAWLRMKNKIYRGSSKQLYGIGHKELSPYQLASFRGVLSHYRSYDLVCKSGFGFLYL